jgi:hypothetical protein
MSLQSQEEDEVWDIMDALCDQTQQTLTTVEQQHKASISLIQALSTDLDAAAFGAGGDAVIEKEKGVSTMDWENDLDIPNFPALSEEMLGVRYDGRKEGEEVKRTSGEF